jgi:hypothetical protein
MLAGRRHHRTATLDPDGTPLAGAIDCLIALRDDWGPSRQDGPGAYHHLRILVAEAGALVFHRQAGDVLFPGGSVAFLPPGWTYCERTIRSQ